MKNYWQPNIDSWIIRENDASANGFNTNASYASDKMAGGLSSSYSWGIPLEQSDEEEHDKLKQPYKGITTLSRLREQINQILEVIPRERTTFLFSATMTSKVAKLQKASLCDPIKVEVSNKFQTPKTLVQQYLLCPYKWKDCYLTYIIDEFRGQSTIIFVATCNNALRVTLLLRNLGFKAVCLHGQLSQPKRLGALNKFKSGDRNILVATDVASRGLDIPNVDMVINYDIPSNAKDYVHRVGRTARAGKAGRSVAFVTQYDVEAYQRLEGLVGQKLPVFPCDEETVLIFLERVNEAQRIAQRELKEMLAQDPKNKKKRGSNKDKNNDNDNNDEIVPSKKNKKNKDA